MEVSPGSSSSFETPEEPQFSILAIGALYRDVIIKVPSFPAEDAKLSATSEHTRVGGNISNTLSVLSQVVPESTGLIYATAVGGPEGTWRPLISALEEKGITMLYEIREGEGHITPTAYIFESQSTRSRTIISHQLIPQLKTGEVLSLLFTHFFPKPAFMGHRYDVMLSEVYNAHAEFYPSWIHFEGRECFMVDGVIDHFTSRKEYRKNPCVISIEFEKYGRPGLERLMGVCNIAFVSAGYVFEFLKDRKLEIESETTEGVLKLFASAARGSFRANTTVFVIVGAEGAYIIHYGLRGNVQMRHIPAPAIPTADILETTGAGDTFIGAAIYAMGYKGWDPLKAARVAVNVASKKCMQIGYDFLGNMEDGFGPLERREDILDESMSERSSVGPEVKRAERLL
ncbi:Ketohexokinase [Dactylella cylindrospora]|nr:Ketohexokinase [Dactylella cylindrospora]